MQKILIIAYETAIKNNQISGGLSRSLGKVIEILNQQYLVKFINPTKYKNEAIETYYLDDFAKRVIAKAASIYTYRMMFDEIEEFSPNVVLMYSFGGNSFLIKNICLQLNIPFIISFRGTDISFTRENFTQFSLVKELTLYASHFIVPSLEFKDILVDLYKINLSKITLIPNIYTEKNKLKRCRQLPLGIVTASRYINEKKGIYELIKSMNFYNASIKSLLIIGEMDKGLEEFYRYQSQKATLPVKFSPVLAKSLLSSKLIESDLYIQASISEGCSNSLVEAIELGLPIQTTNTGFIAEIAREVAPNLIISGWNHLSFRECFVSLNIEEIEKSMIALRTRMRELMNSELIKQQWFKVIENVLK